MDISEQVVSLELAKELKELGVMQLSHFYYIGCFMSRPYENHLGEIPNPESYQECHIGTAEEAAEDDFRSWKGMYKEHLITCSAFTVAELCEMLPAFIDIRDEYHEEPLCLSKEIDEEDDGNAVWCSSYGTAMGWSSDTQANCLGITLRYLITNNLVTEQWRKQWLE